MLKTLGSKPKDRATARPMEVGNEEDKHKVHPIITRVPYKAVLRNRKNQRQEKPSKHLLPRDTMSLTLKNQRQPVGGISWQTRQKRNLNPNRRRNLLIKILKIKANSNNSSQVKNAAKILNPNER